MIVMAVIFFCRIYTHYSGMWIFIQAIGRGATISKFDFKPYTVDLVYQMDLLSTGEVVGMVLMGPLTNIFLLSFMSLFAFLAVRLGTDLQKNSVQRCALPAIPRNLIHHNQRGKFT